MGPSSSSDPEPETSAAAGSGEEEAKRDGAESAEESPEPEECHLVDFHREWETELEEDGRCVLEDPGDPADTSVSLDLCRSRCEESLTCQSFQYSERRLPR